MIRRIGVHIDLLNTFPFEHLAAAHINKDLVPLPGLRLSYAVRTWLCSLIALQVCVCLT